ncbi:uncharacterized protein LOC127285188 [Leptopilina boulardi]|uniref:uncharacterized protein LOC127285188 n=1 Tax=Leptopilina boulardi TaxID=63433 RepID=UPI0021F6015F|nr:uncharacterized protein LOC127285188 [Leptopilina boulardi]
MENPYLNLKIFQDHIWDGYRYIINSVKNNTTYYECIHYKAGTCPARGIEKNGTFNLKKEYTHEKNEGEIEERKFKQELCKRAMTENLTPKQIYDSSRLRNPQTAVNVTFNSMESNLYKWKLRTLPSLPPIPESVQNFVEIINSPENQQWKQFNDGQFSVTVTRDITGSTSAIFIDIQFAERIIADNNMVYLDATYKVVPKIEDAYQLLTLIMIKFNHGFPIAYALMESKSETAYVSVLTEIRRLLPNLNVTSAMSDYETALKNTILYHFPEADIFGCYFHYTQGIFHFACSIGLKRYLKTSEEGKHTLKQLMALAFLPPEKIRQTYTEIKRIKSEECQRILADLFKYYENQWLERVKPEGFSVFGLNRRTNNVLESYHKRLSTKIGKKPSTWQFTKKLADFQAGMRLDLTSLSKGKRITRSEKPITIMRNEFLIRQWIDLEDPNGPTNIEFLERIINFNKDPFTEYFNLFTT